MMPGHAWACLGLPGPASSQGHQTIHKKQKDMYMYISKDQEQFTKHKRTYTTTLPKHKNNSHKKLDNYFNKHYINQIQNSNH